MFLKKFIEFLENLFRSYRLLEHDIEVISKKGYPIYDAEKGRFVKEQSIWYQE